MSKHIQYPHLVGSKWTSIQETDGWRHFEVLNRKNQGIWIFAELVATCDSTVRFWVNAKTLKDPSLWMPGWVSLGDPEKLDEHIRR
ncbi:MAG: TIGR02450 family Trp-rich protein [Cyanobacteria bacterium P01_A01_bin.37]